MLKQEKLTKQSKIFLASLILVFFIVVGAGYFYYLKSVFEINSLYGVVPEIKHKKCTTDRRLDGVCVPKDEDNLWPIAIMIDNAPEAWPQYGLSGAQLVYNVPAEGAHTRMMAIYATAEDVKRIGPVRSARPYFVAWARGLDAVYGHSGGSPDAINKIKEYGVRNWEEATSYGPTYFWRNHSQPSPHNLYTSTERMTKARQEWEVSELTPTYRAWRFDPDANATIETVHYIYLDYSPLKTFDVEYKYDSDSQTYLRYQATEQMMDSLNKQKIAATNVIVQFIPREVVLDSIGRLDLDVIGSGKAWIFYNGKRTIGTWSKINVKSRTIFYDANDQEMIFKPGNIWIEVVPASRQVTTQTYN